MVALNQASQLSNVPSGGGDGSPKDVVQCGVVARLLEEKEEEKKGPTLWLHGMESKPCSSGGAY